MRFTVREKVLVHLSRFGSHREDAVMPHEVTQAGIAGSISVRRPHVSRALSQLIGDGSTVEVKAHVKGMKRRMSVYFLTQKGERLAARLMGREGVDKILGHERERPSTAKRYAFVGRVREMEALRKGLTGLLDEGGPRVITISGETGAGKTRLAEEFCRYAVSMGLRVLRGRCLHPSSTIPYFPVIEMLRKQGLMQEPFPEMDEAERSASARLFMFQKVERALSTLETPSMMFIDDLQWADRDTLHLLGHIAGSISTPLLILCTYRTVEMDVPHRALISTLSRQGILEEISLPMLNEREVSMLVDAILPDMNDMRFKEKVLRSTGGNPFFIIEAITGLLRSGVLMRRDGRWVLTTGGDIPMPDSVREAVLARMDRLDPTTRGIMEAAACSGEVFTVDVLAAAVGMDTGETSSHLGRCISQGLLREREEGYAFEHPYIREAIYGGMNEAERRAMHLRFVNALESLPGEQDASTAYLLAFHALRAGDKKKGYTHCMEAGRRAVHGFAYARAVECFTDALDLARSGKEHEGPGRIFDALVELGSARESMGSWKDALTTYQEASAHAPPGKVSEVEWRLGFVCEKMGRFREAEEHYTQAMEHAADPHMVARIERMQGSLALKCGRVDDSITLCDSALERAKALGDEREVAEALFILGMAHSQKGHHGRARQMYERCLEIRERLKDVRGCAVCHNGLGNTCRDMGDIAQALDHHERCLEMMRRVGDPWGISVSLTNLSSIYKNLGRFSDALKAAKEGLRNFRMLEHAQGVAGVLSNMGLIYLELGDVLDAERTLLESLEVRRRIEDRAGMAISLCNIGTLYLMKGDINRAMQNFQDSMDICRRLGIRQGFVHNMLGFAEIYLLEGALERARGEAMSVLTQADDLHMNEKRGHALTLLGRIYLALGRYGEAETFLREAIKINTGVKNVVEAHAAEIFLCDLLLAKEGFQKGGEVEQMLRNIQAFAHTSGWSRERRTLTRLLRHLRTGPTS